MEIKSIEITELPPELGPPGRRLVVGLDNGKYYTVLVDPPMTVDGLRTNLYHMADQLGRL